MQNTDHIKCHSCTHLIKNPSGSFSCAKNWFGACDEIPAYETRLCNETKDFEPKNLIPNDVSRCNNHRCKKRAECKRYVQLGLDFNKNQTNRRLPTKIKAQVYATVPVTRFSSGKDDNSCSHYLNLEPET